jgi:hypothetical protein
VGREAPCGKVVMVQGRRGLRLLLCVSSCSSSTVCASASRKWYMLGGRCVTWCLHIRRQTLYPTTDTSGVVMACALFECRTHRSQFPRAANQTAINSGEWGGAGRLSKDGL